MKSFKSYQMILGFVGLFIFLSTSLASAEVLAKSDQWKSFAAIYGWVPAFTGDVKIKGLEFDLDTTYADAIDNLKFFFMGHYEGFKGHWGIMVDGMYATLEQLQQDGSLTFSPVNRRGYSYVAEVDGGLHFSIIARPSDPTKQGWPSLSIDETMQIVQQ